MDPYRYDPDQMNDDYPSYQRYYSTGGGYRPPKQPRNYGWLIAILGVVLLCVAGGTAMARTFVGAEAEAEPRFDPMTALSEELESASGAEPVQTRGELAKDTELEIVSEARGELSLQDIYKKVIPSVVSIAAEGGGRLASGTGIIMSSDGYIITNYHVVSTSPEVMVLLESGDMFPAAVVGGDETSDLMVLKIDAKGLTPAEFGNSDSMEVGDTVVAIGDPLGIELRGTMTNGIICGISRDITVEDRTMTLLQTNAALNSGNSGGPLVNLKGQVIGINTMKLSTYSLEEASVEGLGFAIPISTAKPLVDELIQNGFVAGRPACGFTVKTLDARIALYYNLPGRLCIWSVVPGSDAEAQDIRQGDIILGIQGTAVTSIEEFNQIKNQFVAGDTVTLTLFRDGVELTVPVVLMDQAGMK